jgi:hypothetical protein
MKVFNGPIKKQFHAHNKFALKATRSAWSIYGYIQLHKLVYAEIFHQAFPLTNETLLFIVGAYIVLTNYMRLRKEMKK